MNKLKMYIKLFLSTFYLSAFTFGGGYVMVPLMQKKFVESLKWIKQEEMFDLIAIAQSAPGALAVNSSIIIGYRVGGILGGIVALLGTVLPPLIIMCAVTYVYQLVIANSIVAAVMKGMAAGVTAVVVSAVIGMAQPVLKQKSVVPLTIFVVVLFCSFFLEIPTMHILLFCGAVGLVVTMVEKATRSKWNI